MPASAATATANAAFTHPLAGSAGPGDLVIAFRGF